VLETTTLSCFVHPLCDKVSALYHWLSFAHLDNAIVAALMSKRNSPRDLFETLKKSQDKIQYSNSKNSRSI
jgi:hypothetical protein